MASGGSGGNPGSGNNGDNSGNNNEEQNQRFRDLAAVSLTSKIPEFWTDRPSLWFLQAEAMLAPQHLADQVKYNLIITKLSKDVIAQVADILMQPPATEKFKALKERLIQVYEETETRQIQKLISQMELGEQKPSQLLRRMRELAKDRIPDDTLRVLWQGHLPASVRAVLSVADIKELDNLAKVADKVVENSKSLFVSEVSNDKQPARSSGSEVDTDKILKEIAKLNLKINQVSNKRRRTRSMSRNRSRSASRNSRKPRRTEDSPDWLCFYHYRYKERASKCVDPCNWKKQGN